MQTRHMQKMGAWLSYGNHVTSGVMYFLTSLSPFFLHLSSPLQTGRCCRTEENVPRDEEYKGVNSHPDAGGRQGYF